MTKIIALAEKSVVDSEELMSYRLTLYTPTPENGQTHSNNSLANCQRIV